ncbi:endonuclease/exonuclease/phosphatase family protein [Ectothiorhodospira haloalkaliphila]|uniref:endonuclease/exonuclease/phosphatase family protein n=1 Tax=Ectothiorhodospira haloalkaliphila TaxID=421628 RepID=UPI0012EB4F87|nr:endonuclease/exonuclease/phosphatase family protein [Ectothiorhodospira haloalkaliphila]
MLKKKFVLLILFFWVAAPGFVLAEVRIASWNIQHLGWQNDKSYQAVARVASQYDFLAIQELMNAEGIERLEAMLEEKTEESWSSIYSHRLGTSTYLEKYAFLWRDSAVQYVEGAVVYLDDADVFAREPFSAVFRSTNTGQEWVAATVHVVYGRRISDRTPEIHALRGYWDWLGEIYPEHQEYRMLLGDFNLRPGHPAWAELREVAKPLVTRGATTLSTHDRQYANLYDNIWVPKKHGLSISKAGIDRFPQSLSQTTPHYWSHEKARAHVSDHAPVYALLGDVERHPLRSGELYVPNRIGSSGDRPAKQACIDLNESSRSALTRLPHVGPARADQIVDGRPWGGVGDLESVRGLGGERVRDISQSGLLCD